MAMAIEQNTTHQFYLPVWVAVDPDLNELALIEARGAPEGYLGAHRETVRKIKTRYVASIQAAGVWYRSRRYDTAEKAGCAYNVLARFFFGQAATLNDVPNDPTIEAEVIRKVVARQIRQIATGREA
jgi:hypothetical protein